MFRRLGDKNRRTIIRYAENLEPRVVLTAVPFASIPLEAPKLETSTTYNSIIADFDGDNIDDLLQLGSFSQVHIMRGQEDGMLGTPELLYQTPTVFQVSVGAPQVPPSTDFHRIDLFDVDGDGDLDIVGRYRTDFRQESASVLENVNGSVPSRADFSIKPGDFFTDTNRDGVLETVSLTDEQPGLLPASLLPWAPVSGFLRDEVFIDLDLDGDFDAVDTNVAARKIVSYINQDGHFTRRESPIPNAVAVGQFVASDFDMDGDQDLVMYRGARIVALLNAGDGSFVTGPIVELSGNVADALVTDLNGDLIPELSVATVNSRGWQLRSITVNADASLVEELVSETVLDQNPPVLRVAAGRGLATQLYSVNADQDSVYVFAVVNQQIEVQTVFDGGALNQPTSAQFVDVDEDGDLDLTVLSMSEGQIVWYEYRSDDFSFVSRGELLGQIEGAVSASIQNIDEDVGMEVIVDFGTRITIFDQNDAQFQQTSSVDLGSRNVAERRIVDMDQDGDLDVVIYGRNGQEHLEWMETQDGKFGQIRTLAVGVSSAFEVADLNGDDRLDVVTIINETRQPEILFASDNGFQSERSPSSLPADWVRTQVIVTDANNSGGPEVYFALLERVAWPPIRDPQFFKVMDEESEWRIQDVVVDWSRSLFSNFPMNTDLIVTDLNGDNQTELVGAYVAVNLFYFSAVNSLELVSSTRLQTIPPQNLAAADYDLDGDIDLVVFSPESDRVTVFRNETVSVLDRGDVDFDGMISANDIDLLTSQLRSYDVEQPQFDLDLNGRVSSNDRDIMLDQILMVSAGDTNLDGRFDSADLVLAMQSGAFEDSQQQVGWASGDFNGDGVFSTSDLVLAFQTGKYEE